MALAVLSNASPPAVSFSGLKSSQTALMYIPFISASMVHVCEAGARMHR